MPEDNTIQALLDEQTAHAATQAALTSTREENQRLRSERDHWKRAAAGAEEVSAATEAECERLRAELAALQARVARTIAATIPASPDLPPRAEGDVRDGVMSSAEHVATERAEWAERKLARVRRIVHRLVDMHIDDTGR